jgi:hypothetical protein
MADNIVGGLFGVDPAQLQQQRMAQDLKEGFMLAQLSPMERATAGIYAGSKQLGRAGQSLLGMEDPQLQEAAMAKKISENFDVNSVEGLRGLAGALQKAGSLRYSQLAAQQANQLEATVGKAALTEAQTVKALREQRIPTSPLGKLMYERDELLKSGVPANDPRVAAYTRAIDSEGEPKGTKVEVNLGGVFDKAFAKQEAEKQADDWTKAGQAYSDASALARNVREMESVVGNAFVGSYGSLQAGVSRAFGGGKRLNDTEVFDALSAQLVLPLAKLLPGSLAVKELDQLIKTKPNLKQQEGTIRRLLNTINQDLRASELSYEAGEKYREQNNGKISGFNPYIAKNKATRFTELEGIYKSGKKLTDAQKAEAQKLAKELQIEGL